MKTAFITGITGQDATYMAEMLIMKGYKVIGGTRNVRDAERLLPCCIKENVILAVWDMACEDKMISVLSDYQPAEFYNFAAYTSGSGMFSDPVKISEVNGLAIAKMLQAISKVNLSIRFCQASSSEVFGDTLESPQCELSPCNPRSPYGVAKLYADFMVKIYRRHYGIFACSAILYNHVSPRQNIEFVARKITRGAAMIKCGLAYDLCLGNLDATRDWSFAGDIVQAMWLMLQQPQADDYVLATGELHSVRDVCEIAFEYLNLDYRNYVRKEFSEYRPSERVPLVGNSEKARLILGWQPKIAFRDIVQMMVENDLSLIQKSISGSRIV
jgi:GDPmannose 4,6-dehydratase